MMRYMQGAYVRGVVLLVTSGIAAVGCSQEMPEEVNATPEALGSSVATLATQYGIEQVEVRNIQTYLADRIPADAIVLNTKLNGEDVDCVDVHEQPSVRALREAGVDVGVLPTAPQNISDDGKDTGPAEGESEAEQVLDESCPQGTIPIRRVQFAEVAAYGSLHQYLHKEPPAIDKHEYAVVAKSTSNWGAEARINTWSPAGGGSGDFSISQIWVAGGSGATLETVEAGWIKRVGQSLSRLFIFFTPDDYGPNSCWNTDCGFVQTDSSIVLDGTFNSYSSSGGSQYSNTYHLYKDSDTGNWWFSHRDTWVGYWPRSLFDTSGIKNHANFMEWGGEVYDKTGSSHTTIDMGGDGSFPNGSSDFGHAAYMLKIRYNPDNEGHWDEITPNLSGISNSGCYDLIQDYDPSSWKNYIYFGGTGYNATNCPL